MRVLSVLCFTILLLASSVVSVIAQNDAHSSNGHAVWVADIHRGIIKLYADEQGTTYLGRDPDVLQGIAIAVDTHGRVWVASRRDDVLYQINPDTFDEEFLIENVGIVTDLALDIIDDNLVFIDEGRSELVKVTPQGVRLFETLLSHPISVTVNPLNGEIWVGARTVIYKLDQVGRVLLELKNIVNFASDIAVDPVTGQVWVADEFHSQIIRLSNDGKILSTTSVRNPEEIAFNLPYGGLAVLDKRDREIHFLDETGAVFRTLSEGLDNPRTIAIDPVYGHLWVSSDTNGVSVIKRYSADGGVFLGDMAGFTTPTSIAFDFSDKKTNSDLFFPVTREKTYPRIPSKLSTPLFEPVTLNLEKSGGDKGVWRSSLRDYMNGPLHFPQQKAYDQRALEYRTYDTVNPTISDLLFSYCQELLSSERSPFKYSPYTEPVRLQVIMNECNFRTVSLGYYTGIIPYDEPPISPSVLSPLPSVEEVKAQSNAPYP